MAHEQNKEEQGEQKPRTERQGDEVATLIPEPRFSVDIKKTRKEAIEQVDDQAQTFPFELGLNPISSQEVSPSQLLAGLQDEWIIRPVLLDNVQNETVELESSSTLEPPHLKIWESARLSPTTPLHEPIDSLEISLPPRHLLSVESLEKQADGKGNQSDEEDTKNDSGADTEETEHIDIETEGDGEERVRKRLEVEGPPPLDEFLFETVEGSLTSREPICVVAAKRDDDKYQQTLETLCREQFRQYIGGKPLADLLAPNETDSVEATRIQNRIVAYDDSDSDFFEFKAKMENQDITRELLEKEGEGNLARLHSRVDEFFTANLGYLLLFVDNQYADVLYDHLVSAEDIRESNEIILLRLRQLPDDVKRKLVRLAWGNVSIDTNRRDLDSLFHTAEDRFGEEIEPKGEIEEITRHDQEESILHYWVKCFVVDCLLVRENLKPVRDYSRPDLKEEIQTEEIPWGESGPRPDVYIERSKEVFEIETLYGTDHKKINRTIDKYEGWPVKQINVVLPNLTCLRNLEAVLRKTQEEPGEMFRNDVEFWTLDLDERELLSVDNLAQTLHELHDRSEKVMQVHDGM